MVDKPFSLDAPLALWEGGGGEGEGPGDFVEPGRLNQ